jgi:Na+/glutamate symporter
LDALYLLLSFVTALAATSARFSVLYCAGVGIVLAIIIGGAISIKININNTLVDISKKLVDMGKKLDKLNEKQADKQAE